MNGTIIGIREILKLLPQRPPYLMIDRALLHEDGRHIEGIKNITYNEEYFSGHFPSHPVMPGVLQLETIIQLAELAAKKGNRMLPGVPYVCEMRKVKFRQPVMPGTRLHARVSADESSDGNWVLTGETFEGDTNYCQAELVLRFLDQKHLPEPTEFAPPLHTLDYPSSRPPLDVLQIMDLIPHRYPFLLIDQVPVLQVSEDGEGHVVGLKNISFNEPYFYRLGGPVPMLPNTIQVEIAAQLGCACVMSLPGNAGKVAYFMSLRQATFHRPILPGDQMLADININVSRGRFGRGIGKIYVGNDLVSDIDLNFAIVDERG